jgi:hypothetical protein
VKGISLSTVDRRATRRLYDSRTKPLDPDVEVLREFGDSGKYALVMNREYRTLYGIEPLVSPYHGHYPYWDKRFPSPR